MERGKESMIPFGPTSERQRGEAQLPPQPSSTASRSRRPKGGPRGYDAGKKVMGRKRHIVVDTVGLVLAVVVHPADIQDRDGAKLVLSKLLSRFPQLRLIWDDAGYAGQLVDWVMSVSGWVLKIVRRPRSSHQFEVLPRRWVVERTLAWLGRCRLLSRDYEALSATTEAWVHLAMIHLMVRRLTTS